MKPEIYKGILLKQKAFFAFVKTDIFIEDLDLKKN